jgi:hypothetical protein
MIPGYEIRIAAASERDQLRAFIDTHWKKGHALAASPSLLDWQHYDEKKAKYNFVIGVHRQRQEIDGLLGFIPVSQFDEALEPSRDYWLALWKVREDIDAPGLGVALYYYFQATQKPRTLSGAAISSIALPIYRALKFRMGKLDHFYLLNPDVSEFKIAEVLSARAEGPISPSPGSKELVRVPDKRALAAYGPAIDALNCRISPLKSAGYYGRRYLDHPLYRYDLFAVLENGQFRGLLVTRAVSHEGACALRIVDVGGPSDALADLNGALVGLLRSSRAEFIDFYCTGFEDRDLLGSGFRKRAPDPEPSAIIPNYFEPFVRKNVDLDYAVKHPENAHYRFVKGDSDQDRPNLITGAP